MLIVFDFVHNCISPKIITKPLRDEHMGCNQTRPRETKTEKVILLGLTRLTEKSSSEALWFKFAF